jgi:hypothetical protein
MAKLQHCVPPTAIPSRQAAIEMAAKFTPGMPVQIRAEEFRVYGEKRSEYSYPGRVVALATLSGSSILTGRILVETTTVIHYQKTATRKGTRVYQTAEGPRRVVAVWPWDVAPGE